MPTHTMSRGVALFLGLLGGTCRGDLNAQSGDKDLLGRLYAEFERYGGASNLIRATDEDMDGGKGGVAVPSIENVRSRFYNGGRLPEWGSAPGEVCLHVSCYEMQSCEISLLRSFTCR